MVSESISTGVAQALQQEEEDDDEEQGEEFQFDDSEDENNAGQNPGEIKDFVASAAETGLKEVASGDSTNSNALYSQAVKHVPVTHHEELNGVTSAGQEGQTVPHQPHITSPGKGFSHVFIMNVLYQIARKKYRYTELSSLFPSLPPTYFRYGSQTVSRWVSVLHSNCRAEM